MGRKKKTGSGGSSRREFIKQVGSGALVLGAAGCLPHVEGEWPSCKKEIEEVPPPTSNRVVEIVAPGVVDAESYTIVQPERIPGLIAEGLLALTRAGTLEEAWSAILPDRQAGDVVGFKVNCLKLANVKTSHLVVKALIDTLLRDGGVPAEEALVWDRTDAELRIGNFAEETMGVPCTGTEPAGGEPGGPGYEQEAVCLSDRPIFLSTLLTRTIRHLINVPVVKNHFTAGFTGALKNHYGSFSRPGDFHQGCGEHIARLNALPQIAGISRLHVADALISVCRYDTDGPADCAPGRILFSFDPVALDRRGVEIRDEMLGQAGAPADYLDLATELGLGAAEYDLVRIEI